MSARHEFDWPPLAVRTIKEGQDAHLSASQIAGVLTKLFRRRITRNAVIGKMHRLKPGYRRSAA